MFKLFNNYPLSSLVKRVRWNARIMFLVYLFFISIGVISILLAARDMPGSFWFLLLMSVLIAMGLICFVPFLLYDYYKHKYHDCSLLREDSDALEIWDHRIRCCEKIGDRFGVSSQFLFSLCSTFYIPFGIPVSEIAAVYSLRFTRKGKYCCSPDMYILRKNGKIVKMPLGGRFVMKEGGLRVNKNKLPLDERVLSKIQEQCPDLFLGIRQGRYPVKKISRLQSFPMQEHKTN